MPLTGTSAQCVLSYCKLILGSSLAWHAMAKLLSMLSCVNKQGIPQRGNARCSELGAMQVVAAADGTPALSALHPKLAHFGFAENTRFDCDQAVIAGLNAWTYAQLACLW